MIRRPPRSTRTDTLCPYSTLFRSWRTALQERLRAELSVSGAGLVRYLYGLPFAILFAVLWLSVRGDSVPPLTSAFLGFAVAGALTQMARSEERRVGKECVSTCRSRCSPYH